MASSCLGQVAGPTTTVSSKSFSVSLNNHRINSPRICLNSSFVAPFLNASSGLRRSAPKRSNIIIAADTLTSASETAEVEPEVAPDVAEVPIVEVESAVEVEQSEAPAARGSKAKKTKGLKNIMQKLHQMAIEAATEGKDIPDIRVGDIVQLRVEVPENKKRVSLLRGIVIGRQNAGIHTTFRIRRVMAGVGVEMVFPLYSPNIKEIKVVNSRKVRRAKLYYLRDKLARLSTV